MGEKKQRNACHVILSVGFLDHCFLDLGPRAPVGHQVKVTVEHAACDPVKKMYIWVRTMAGGRVLAGPGDA